LFAGYGIEIEHMIVRRGSLSVLPICDRLLKEEGGSYGDVTRGDIAWSNELVLHVVELKTNGPSPTLSGLAASFQREVRYIDDMLAAHDGRLMPTAMHPWMDPARETQLWPHDYNEVYELFDRIFDCKGHGWSNLQSMHINLPFASDDDLTRLQAAVRLVLPLLPGLAASSPIIEGRVTGLLDNRLELYRHNCRAIPSVTARVIPEPVTSRADYRARILEPIRRDIAPHDARGVLDPEWVNARGAIARFARDAIEIRVIDTQEHPLADLSIAALTVAAVRSLCEERHLSLAEQLAIDVEPLEQLLVSAIREGERAVVDERLCRAFGVSGPCEVRRVWQELCERELSRTSEYAEVSGALATIFDQGPLARRIVNALDAGRTMASVYGKLCECLREGEMFRA
jgi:gamma-glutamyl:cysteine ligase YbdK (ATP-grasp superfamily)